MSSMTTDQLEKFLAMPLIATFTSLRSDGSPHVSPMWYQYKNGKIYCQVGANAAKTRKVLKDPRVALCIFTQKNPQKCAMVYGTCQVTRDSTADWVYSISRRYYGMEKGTAYAKSLLDTVDMEVMVITPTRIVTEQWD